MTGAEMQGEFDKAMGILLTLSHQREFNTYVSKYELGMSFDEWVVDTWGKVEFSETPVVAEEK